MDQNDTELLDSEIEPTEEVDNTDDIENSDTELEPEDVEAFKEKNKKLYERAKKAEAKLKELTQKPKVPEAPQQPPQQPKQPDIDALVSEKLEQRDLEALDVPEDLKPEIQKLAKLQGISVRKAAQDSYIQHRIEEVKKQARVDDAAVSRSKKGATVKFDPNKPPQVDMSTEEGQKTWNEYKKFLSQSQ